MIVIGIDPGTKTSPTAFAVLNEKTVLASVQVAYTKGAKSGKLLHDVEQQLILLLETYPVDLVTSEEPFLQGLANKSMNRLLGVIEKCCWEQNVELRYISPMSVKKEIGGTGKADKLDLAKAVKRMVSDPDKIDKMIEDEDWDKTDSIAIALTGLTGRAK